MNSVLSAMAIVSFASAAMLRAVCGASLAALQLTPSLTLDVQCLLAPYRYALLVEHAAPGMQAPANGAAPPRVAYCCQITLAQQQRAWIEFQPRQFDQFWELRKRLRPGQQTAGALPGALPEVTALIKGLVDTFPSAVAPPASLVSPTLEPVAADKAVSVEVRHAALAQVLHYIAKHVSTLVTRPRNQSVI